MKLVLTDGGRRDEAVPFDQPCGVVGFAEREQREAEFLDGLECSQPQQVLLERSDDAFSVAIAFGRAHEGGRAGHLEEPLVPGAIW